MAMRFLFSSLGSYGMLFPMIGLAISLRDRGHEAAFLTHPSMIPVLKRFGFERIPWGPEDGEGFQMKLINHPLDTLRQVRHIEYAMERFPPDVLVGQPLLHGPTIAGRRHGVPVAVLGLGAYIWPTEALLQERWNVASLHYPKLNYPASVLGRYQSFISSWDVSREMFALPGRSDRYEETPIIGDLFLLQSVAELEGNVDALPPQVHLIGDCLWDLPHADPELTAWLEESATSGHPVVYLNLGPFGTNTENSDTIWERLIAGLGDQPVRVAASIGRTDTRITAIPPNFFVRDHVPQGAVLPQARVMICTGSTTAVIGAITHGVPLLLIPGGGGAEQVDLLLRCLRAGVGLDLSTGHATPDMIARRMWDVMESSQVRENTRRMQQAFAQAGGRERAADLRTALANLSAAATVDLAERAVAMIGADLLQIHLNAPQELMMAEGDRDFRGQLRQIEKLVRAMPVPVVVKECGFGLSREAARRGPIAPGPPA